MLNQKYIFFILIAMYGLLLPGCATLNESHIQGVVKIRNGDYVASGIILNDSMILTSAHLFQTRSIDSSSLIINDHASVDIALIADGWSDYRRQAGADFEHFQSYDVKDDYALIHSELPLACSKINVTNDIKHTIKSSPNIYLVTISLASKIVTSIPVNNLAYDQDHRVIVFSCSNMNPNDFYLSGSPLIAASGCGSPSLFGIVSGTADAIPVNGVPLADAVLACPIDTNLLEGKENQ